MERLHCIQDTSPGPQGVHNRGVPLYTCAGCIPLNSLVQPWVCNNTLLPVDHCTGLSVQREVPLTQHGGQLPRYCRVAHQSQLPQVGNQGDWRGKQGEESAEVKGRYCIQQIQWNPSIVDTLGNMVKCPVINGNFTFKKAYLGHSKVSLIQRCPYFRGVL